MTNLNANLNSPWLPKYYTDPLSDNTLGEEVSAFAEAFLIALRGFRGGQPIVLTDWQQWLTNNIFELNSFGMLRYKTAVIMVPRKNGKTFLCAIYVLFHLLTAPQGAEIYSAAKNREQARLIYDLVVFWIEQNPALQAVLKVEDSKNIIRNRMKRSFYKALSADAGGAHGLAPYVVIADEIHAWEAEHTTKRAQEFWNALTKGSADRAESQVIAISTAGDNVNDSLLGSLYKRGVEAAESKSEEDRLFGFFCWEADEGDSPLEVETWRKANPNIAEGLLNEDSIAENLASSAATNISTFLRDHLNIWSSIAGEPFMPSIHWGNACREGFNIPLGARITIGFDASKRGDSTVIMIQDYVTGLLKVYRAWERPKNADDSWFIDRDEVQTAMKEIFELYDVVDCWADKFYYESDIKKWQRTNKWKITSIAQSRDRIKVLASEFLRDVIDGTTTHTGEEILTRHVSNALMSEDKGYTKEQRNSRAKIDGLAAAVMANGARNFNKGRENKNSQRPMFF